MKAAKSNKPSKPASMAEQIAELKRMGLAPVSAPEPVEPIEQWVLDEFKHVTFPPPLSKPTKESRALHKAMLEVMKEDGWL